MTGGPFGGTSTGLIAVFAAANVQKAVQIATVIFFHLVTPPEWHGSLPHAVPCQ
jgi:hypothetical protein